jgi:hypothetical protein
MRKNSRKFRIGTVCCRAEACNRAVVEAEAQGPGSVDTPMECPRASGISL